MTNRFRFILSALFSIGLSGLTTQVGAQQTGLTRETWSNLSAGKSILILRKEGISTRAADSTSVVSSASISGLPTSTGARLRGSLTPLITDNYTFWVNGASNVALWISEDGSRFNKQLVAWNTETTTNTEWTKHASQRSVPIQLTAGTTYYIEAHVMSGAANGHLAIAWQGNKGNWALAANGATATQSTTQWALDAGKAIDGNTSNVWNQATLTTNVQNSWLKVNFGATRSVNQIKLFNISSSQNRLSNFRLSLLDASGNTLTSQDFFTTSGNVGNTFAWDLPSVYQAAAVKIQLLGNNLALNGHLTLAEIQAFHNPGPATNYALATNGASAAQTSTSGQADASKAIDGNTSGNFDNGSVTLTNDLPNSALEIDLGQDRSVNRVLLHNRDTLQTRLSNFRISLLDASNQVITSEDRFTTSGNAGNVLYWNLVSSVVARKIRVEILGNNLDGNGHLSVAEVQAFEIDPLLESRDFQVIPAAYLTSIGPDPADVNSNNLSDAWETSTGLASSILPGALLEYGDPDQDGIYNYLEQLYGSNPLVAESLGDGLTQSIWTDFLAINVKDFVNNRARYLSYPNKVTHVAGIDAKENRQNFGTRYRGAIIAPATGNYRFWLSASSDAQLWLSDGTVRHPVTNQPLTNRFGKQLLATSGSVTPIYDYDYRTNQRSRTVFLTEGQEYYIEVLHKVAQGSGDHISVAWQVPGQGRILMPADAFIADAPDAADADNDNLEDAWEIAKTLSPTDNGITNANNGELGDPDLDKLTNLQEFQYGTNPKAADTDGDSYNDHDEIFYYGTNPLVSNNLNPITLTLPQLDQYSTATGGWTANTNGSLTAWDRRGGITYTFTVTEPGVHEVSVAAGAISYQPWITKSLPLELSLNNEAFAKQTILSSNGNASTMRAVTPWLAAGTHTLTIFHNNVLTEVRLRIDSLSVKRLGGADLDEDNVPDWIAANEAPTNTLTRIAEQSLTSPASIEGITRQFSSATITALLPGATEAQAVTLTPSINNTFFADVTLSPNGPVALETDFLSGVVSQNHSITWVPTNLFDYNQGTLHIRKGDSLRITAHEANATPQGTFTLTGNYPNLPSGALNADAPHILTFATAGTYTLQATYGSQTTNVTITVHSVNFGASHQIKVGSARVWNQPTLDHQALIEADDRLIFSETTVIPGSGPRLFRALTHEAGNSHVIARLPQGVDGAPAAILARGTVQAFDIAEVDRTRDSQVVHRYDDGIWLMSNTIVAINLPPNVFLRLTVQNQGTIFSNGSNIMDLRASDFDANGIATIFYEWNGTGSPKLCHSAQLFYEPQ